MKKITILFSAVLVFSAVATSAWFYADRDQIQNTEDKYRAIIENAFIESLISLSIDSQGAHFKISPNGQKFVLGDPNTVENFRFIFEFTLSEVGQIIFAPSHHGSVTYTVKEIRNDRIVLHYLKTFYHTSFKNNIRGRDEGVIIILQTGNVKK